MFQTISVQFSNDLNSYEILQIPKSIHWIEGLLDRAISSLLFLEALSMHERFCSFLGTSL